MICIELFYQIFLLEQMLLDKPSEYPASAGIAL